MSLASEQSNSDPDETYGPWLVVKRSSSGEVSGWDGIWIVDAETAEYAIRLAAEKATNDVADPRGTWFAVRGGEKVVRLAVS